MDNISLIIQGPFDNHIWNKYRYLDRYTQFFNRVVISCYNTDDTKSVEEYIDNKSTFLIKSDVPSYHCNPCNIYKQAFSTKAGIDIIDTEFTIKIRCNEYFHQINKCVDMLLSSPDKYFVCNINTLKVRHNSWKVSDHMFGGKTNILKKAIQQVMDWCHEDNSVKDKHTSLSCSETMHYGQAEHVFFMAYLKHCGVNLSDVLNLDRIGVVNTMKKYLTIINVNDLAPITWSCHDRSENILYSESYHYGEIANNLEELGENIC